MNKTEAVKKAVLLLGSFAIAYNISQFLHELGHAIAAWTSSGHVFGIVLHPFSWSYCYAVSPYPVFLSASGVLFSSLIAVLIFMCLIRWPKSWLMPMLLIGPVTLFLNGVYLLVDYLIKSRGDACSLVTEGVSPLIIIAGSIVSLVFGFMLAAHLFRKANLLDDGFKARLVVISVGVVPYLLTAFIWNFFFNRSEALIWLAYTASGSVLAVLFAALTRCRKMQEPEPNISIGWKTVCAVNATAMLLVVYLLIGPLPGVMHP